MANDYVSTVLLLLSLLIFLSQRTDSASIVKSLPGFDGPLPFELETGYIGVGEEEEVQLFYYFIKSERNPQEDPLLLWLSGGPGCSSISGLLYENGPVNVKIEVYNGTLPSLVSTTYSWTKVSSIIYLDQPVGTGFSYSRTKLVNKPSDSGEAKRIHEFLHKWLGKHQEFSSNPFYVGGDSYCGMVIPALVQEISKGNYVCCKPPINLQGYILGNPSTENEVDINYRIPYAHGMALISDELYESMKRICKGKYENVDPRNTKCLKLVGEYQKCTKRINKALIITPECVDTSPDCYMYRYLLTTYWANDENVQRALHVNKGSIGEWVRCYFEIPYNHDIKSSVPYHMNNSIDGYASLIFSGDHDMEVPYLGTQAWIRSLNYSLIDDWRPWMIGDQIAGPGIILKVNCESNNKNRVTGTVKFQSDTVRINFREAAFERTTWHCLVQQGGYSQHFRAYRGSAPIPRCGELRVYIAKRDGIYLSANAGPEKLDQRWMKN
ncbi:Alpha/Beta hydrolase fold [Arabidopsis suecica]|uniref:Alpha/Beta hydrolase fold n=1 Tax=Arabidopsis suecica TaxID=45249 RepID=A0A8T2F545_ARASU|nr:Alpha/Beta hydrolase fold [Arabidopsis suecica]